MPTEIKTFLDIKDAVREELGIQAGDTKAVTKISTAVNRIYVNKVAPAKRWWWLRKDIEVVHAKKVTDDATTVTEDSVTVVLGASPDVGLGSFADSLFTTNSFDEEYRISAHTAGSDTITLVTAYQGPSSTTSSATIWRDTIDLPTDARETVDVWHDRHDRPMTGKGPQELRVIRLSNKGREGFPQIYDTTDFKDPSAAPETEADRFRRTEIFPARNTEDLTLHVSYMQEVDSLSADADEPLMPIEDRDVLVEGALSIVWRTLSRDPEEAQLARQRFEDKLGEMAARVEDSFDTPVIAPNSRYLRAQRDILRRNRFRDF